MDKDQYIRYISENFTSKSVDLAHAQMSITPWASLLLHKLYHNSHAVLIRSCSHSLWIVHADDAVSIDYNMLWSWTGAAHYLVKLCTYVHFIVHIYLHMQYTHCCSLMQKKDNTARLKKVGRGAEMR